MHEETTYMLDLQLGQKLDKQTVNITEIHTLAGT